MISGKIKTYNDLLEEEQRVLMQFKRDKAKLVEELNQIKNKLKPAEHFFHTVNNWFQKPPAEQFLPRILDIGIDFISRKMIFKNAGWFKSFFGSYTLRTASQWMMNHFMHQPKRHQDGTDETLNQ